MPKSLKKMPCEAVILRYMHSAVTGEFLNIGIALQCDQAGFLSVRFAQSFTRLTNAFDSVSTRELRALCKLLSQKVKSSGQLALQEPPSLTSALEMLLHTSNSSIQLSPTVTGVTVSPSKMLNQLFHVYVGEPVSSSNVRQDDSVWRGLATKLGPLAGQMQSKVVSRPHYELEFKHSWKNGKWNSVQPLSFDASKPDTLRDKAAKWVGKIQTAKPWDQGVHVSILVGPPRLASMSKAFEDATEILGGLPPENVQVIRESESDSLVDRIRSDLLHH